MILEPGGFVGSNSNLRPDVIGHLPSREGHSETPFSSNSRKILPVTLILSTLSVIGKTYAMNFHCKFPCSKTWLALKLPPFVSPKSVSNSDLHKSANIFPKLVSSVLTLENLASRSTLQYPASRSSFLLSSSEYLSTCS